jgi:hypothetical protein
MSNDRNIEQYYQDFKEFKIFFIDHCGIDKKYEAYKVWAHWLIRNLCKNGINYHLIPSIENVAKDTDVLYHMKEKGVSVGQIKGFYGQVVAQITALSNKYTQMKINQLTSVEKIAETSKNITCEVVNKGGKQMYMYKYGEVFVKYYSYTHDRLLSRYIGDKRCLSFYMFEMGFNYYMLDGHSFQWCIPPKAFMTLEKMLSLKTEFFASPINATVPNYYSLFVVDKYFGAIDNFFNIDTHQILSGTYEVNPPFIEYVFVESSKIVISLLNNSQTDGKELLFIYVMPEWLDSEGYKMLANSGYLLDEVILGAERHFYHQSSKHKMISANFGSHVLILGTSIAKGNWNHKVKDKFIENFTHY